MGYVAKLVREAREIDLSSGRYSLGLDFKPGVSSFSVKISGSSTAEVRQGVDDIALFLRYCGDPADPTYFEWRPDNNVDAEPVWGQFGAPRRVKLMGGDMEYWDTYMEAETRASVAFVRLSLVFGSEAEGVRQLAAEAKGGICEDLIGVANGRSRGVQIPISDATNGNKFTNPVFGHSIWNNGWTAGTAITAVQNTDPNFILYGLSSAKLSSLGTAGNTFTQSINPGTATNHIVYCYGKLPNSGSISSTQAQIYCGSALTTVYTPAGDGWYRLHGTSAGGTAAVATGVLVKSNYTIYIDANQMEQRSYPSEFFYGDMLGCSWDSTVHASKSLRSDPQLTLPTSGILGNTITLRIVWKAGNDSSSSNYLISRYIYDDNQANYLQYNQATTNWICSTYGGIIADNIVDTWSAGDIKVFHVVWAKDTGLAVYLNGSLKDTGEFNTLTFGTDLYIGQDAGGLNRKIGGTFMGFDIYHKTMTAAEVLADYNNIAQIIADGQGLDPILYQWTGGGDGIVDNVDSGSNENWSIIGGVPGDLPAKVEASLTIGGINDADVYLSRLDIPYNSYLDPEYLTNATLGTVSVGTAGTALITIPLDNDEFRLLAGRKLAVMLRGDEGTANNLSLRTGINPGGKYYYTDWKPSNWNTGTPTSIDTSPEIFMIDELQYYRTMGYYMAGTVNVEARRSSGTADFIVHAAQILPYPITRFSNQSAGGTTATITYIDGKGFEVRGSALAYTYRTDGAKIELMPNRYNLLTTWLGAEGSLSEPGDTLTYSAVYVTPRWRMM